MSYDVFAFVTHSPDRLPHYERVFNQIISEQVYRYNDVPHPDDHAMHVSLFHKLLINKDSSVICWVV